ncbi:hypothetical protein EX895_001546 [Sporisorium graminicola]|uniref:Uncharacterized protein n=1 Tax=Sporisorium graminicola TaxID=280036 RepID=A0A4U7KY52_9BASI|nr:hypothetical protein EX895_001546 [Sporisorium graminicola]TKY89761.1 hypothetical protein EX895_001546 [Sporisorium graminicola]
MKDDKCSMWMAEEPDEARSQIGIMLTALSNGKYEYFTIYRVPPDTEYDEFPDMDEVIQSRGYGQRFTVEVFQIGQDGLCRLFVVGHAQAANDCDECEQITAPDGAIDWVRPAEVLDLAEAISLFQHYYDHDCIPAGWHLRERPEFTREVDITD